MTNFDFLKMYCFNADTHLIEKVYTTCIYTVCHGCELSCRLSS